MGKNGVFKNHAINFDVEPSSFCLQMLTIMFQIGIFLFMDVGQFPLDLQSPFINGQEAHFKSQEPKLLC